MRAGGGVDDDDDDDDDHVDDRQADYHDEFDDRDQGHASEPVPAPSPGGKTTADDLWESLM
jgi:hypothetical protein